MDNEVYPVNGIVITYAAADYLVKFIDYLVKTAGMSASARLANIRNDLIRHSRNTHADASPEVVSPLDFLGLNADGFVDPAAAAKRIGTTDDNVRYLCRRGHFGVKVGDRWLISEAELEAYAARRDAKRRRNGRSADVELPRPKARGGR